MSCSVHTTYYYIIIMCTMSSVPKTTMRTLPQHLFRPVAIDIRQPNHSNAGFVILCTAKICVKNMVQYTRSRVRCRGSLANIIYFFPILYKCISGTEQDFMIYYSNYNYYIIQTL